jgi:hypothetical protein
VLAKTVKIHRIDDIRPFGLAWKYYRSVTCKITDAPHPPAIQPTGPTLNWKRLTRPLAFKQAFGDAEWRRRRKRSPGSIQGPKPKIGRATEAATRGAGSDLSNHRVHTYRGREEIGECICPLSWSVIVDRVKGGGCALTRLGWFYYYDGV